MSDFINHQNDEYSGGFPIACGDRRYSQDIFRDMRNMQQLIGKAYENIFGATNIIIEGCVPSQGVGHTLNLTAGKGLVKFQVTVPDSWANIPPTTQNKDLYLIAELPVLTNWALTSTTNDGATTNYLKLAYAEIKTSSRARAKKVGSWNSEITPSYILTADSTPPTNYEISLATFTTDGATISFIGYGIRIDFKLKGTSSFPMNNPLNVSNTTDSTTKDTGAIITEGGIGIEKDISSGAVIRAADGFECEYRNSAGVESKKSLHTKIIEIGDWNMDTTVDKAVAHGIGSAFLKVRSIDIIIRDDDGAVGWKHPLSKFEDAADPELLAGGYFGLNSSSIYLRRRTGGWFDDALFNSTSYNRGWIYVVYED